jgi:hypothetical protein
MKNCEQYRDLLNRYLDGETDADALGDHAGRCPDCAALHRGAHRLTQAFALLRPPTPPGTLTDDVLRGLHADQRRRIGLRFGLAAAAIAAFLMLAFGVHLFRPRPQGNEVAVAPPTVPPAPAVPAPTLRETVNEASQAFGQLTARAADETVAPARTFWPVLKPAPLDEWDRPVPLEDSTRPLKETGQSAVVAIEPVTRSARRALDLLLRDLPPMDKPAKPGS